MLLSAHQSFPVAVTIQSFLLLRAFLTVCLVILIDELVDPGSQTLHIPPPRPPCSLTPPPFLQFYPAINALTDVFLQPALSPANPWIIRAGHRMPGVLPCSLSHSSLMAALSLPHSCGRGAARYFLAGHWLTWQLLEEELLRSAATATGKPASSGGHSSLCVMVCTDRTDLQCLPRLPCLHAFHLRKQLSGR